jgi:hypothetical protein
MALTFPKNKMDGPASFGCRGSSETLKNNDATPKKNKATPAQAVSKES